MDTIQREPEVLIAEYEREAAEYDHDASLLYAEAAITKARASGKRKHAEFLRECIGKLRTALSDRGG
jgi:hypothetical protein